MKFINLIIVLLSITISYQASAHKMKSAITTVLFNDRTGNIEVMHRFYLHDAEEAVWELFDKAADIIGSQKTQQQFSDYVEKRFIVADQNKQPLTLTLLGSQSEGGYFWIYQETPIPQDLTALFIKNGALQDVWPEQYNMLNVEGLGKIKTLEFDEPGLQLSVSIKN